MPGSPATCRICLTAPLCTVIPLWDWPGELVVNPCHPLARERRLTRSDLSWFPSLILPESLYPRLARVVHAKGFGQESQLKRYDVGSWDGLTEDAATISFGSCLSLAADSNLQSLDWDLGLTGGEALILLTEWAENRYRRATGRSPLSPDQAPGPASPAGGLSVMRPHNPPWVSSSLPTHPLGLQVGLGAFSPVIQ